MLLQIRGYHLPGRVWQSRDEHYDNVHVGIQDGKEPRELVRGDAETSSWTIPIEVVAREGGLDFRGAAVQGRPGARFVYLTWGDVDADGSFAMFRRAKLMLADLEPVVAGAGDTRPGDRTCGSHRRVRRAAVRPPQAARIAPRESRRLRRRVSRFRRARVPADYGDTATPPGDRPARTARVGPQPC